MSTTPIQPPGPPTVRATGSDAELAREGTRASSAHTVTVRVVVDRFRFGGRDYQCRDELEVPAEHLQAWLESGRVRLVERSRDANGMRDGRVHSDEFTNNGR
ncbi:MAG: hypothetical protein ACRDTX_30765 [Pseudonocardiaceae bacterium]